MFKTSLCPVLLYSEDPKDSTETVIVLLHQPPFYPDASHTEIAWSKNVELHVRYTLSSTEQEQLCHYVLYICVVSERTGTTFDPTVMIY